MIIISFTITISWIKYSYNFFRLKDEEIVDMIEVSYYNHCPCRFCYHRAKKYHPKLFPLPTLYLCQNLICPPASRLYLNELLSILQTVSSCSRYTTFFLFGSRFHRQNLLYPSALRSDLRTNRSLNADVSENTLPFVSQSINNFSDYDISQTHDWECPSLSPHVLLLQHNTHMQANISDWKIKTDGISILCNRFVVFFKIIKRWKL